MSPKRLLVIAAGYLQTFLIRKAKEKGYYVLAIDGNPNAEGFQYADETAVIDITNPDACTAYARTKDIDGVVTAASDYGVISTSEVAKALGLPGLNTETARLIKNKYLVRKRLYEFGVDDSNQAYEVTSSSDFTTLGKLIKYPVIVKPCDGSGSRGTSRVDNEENLEDACKKAIASSLTHKAEIETFIEGNEYGVESFIKDGDIYIMGVMKKWMTSAPNYAELGHSIPSLLPPELEAKVKSCIKNALKALGVNFGSVNMDLLITRNGNVHIIDVGARMGGNLIGSHIIPFGTGIDYMGNIVAAAVGDPIIMQSKSSTPIVTKLLALTPGKVKNLPDFGKIERENNVMIEHHLKIGDEITPYRTNLDGCGYVIVTGLEINDAEKKATEILHLIDKLIQREDVEINL